MHVEIRENLSFGEYEELSQRSIKPHRNEREAYMDWLLGLYGEGGEIAELFKHAMFHKDNTIDKMKLAKEIGDKIWYLAALARQAGIPFQACADLNVAKLAHRHALDAGGSFNVERSANRHSLETDFEQTAAYRALRAVIVGEGDACLHL